MHYYYMVEIVWGRNFVADAEIVSVVAGIYAMVRPRKDIQIDVDFNRLGVLAALFALGTVEERASNETVVRPPIDGIYICFMILPIFLSVMLILLSRFLQKGHLPIPRSP
jgi:hypothetical protein